MADAPKWDDGLAAAAAAQIDRQRKLNAATPTQADVKDAFRDRFRETEDGKWKVDLDLSDPRQRGKWKEIKRRWNRTAYDVIQTEQAAVDRIRMRSPAGDMREVPVAVADSAGKRGFRTGLGLGRRRRRLTGSDYDPNRRLRTHREIYGY